jgi:hypothetical protein
MNFDDAFKHIDAALFEVSGRHMNAPEVTLLKGTWQGMTYEQMADNSQYSLNYLMRDIGPKFWRTLSNALGENVSKTNIRVLLEQRSGEPNAGLDISIDALPPAPTRGRPRKNPVEVENRDRTIPNISQNPLWDLMPEGATFYGRSEEMDTLQSWVLDEGCPLISLSGLSGIGKTAIARELVDHVQGDFEQVFWRSLAHGPSLNSLATNLLKNLDFPYSRANNLISQLMTYLKEHRCLIILDDFEALLEVGQLSGQFRTPFTDYGIWLEQLAEVAHTSCLVVLGLESPMAIGSSDGTSSRSLTLTGLADEEAHQLLEDEDVDDRGQWSALIEQYQGYPAALLAVTDLSRTLFNSKIGQILDRQTFVFGEIKQLLDKSFQRLSDSETEVMFYLAMAGEPLSFNALEQGLPIASKGNDLFDILSSLRRRSLLATPEVKGQSLFALPPLIMEYVIGILIQRISGAPTPESHRSTPAAEEVLDLTPPANATAICLSQWLDHQFEVGWQPVSAYFSSTEGISVRLRSTYHLRHPGVEKRFKQLSLGASKADSLSLLVAVKAEGDERLGVRVQVQPTHQEELPKQVSLTLLNEEGQVIRQVSGTAHDPFLQLPYFRGSRGDTFQIQVHLGSQQVSESFVI